MRKIIDFHAHVFPEKIAQKATDNVGNHYGIKMRGKGTIEDLLSRARNTGVSKTVFHATATKPEQVTSINNWIAESATDELIGFGTIHPDFHDIEGEIDRIIKLGLKGIKIHSDFQGFDIDDRKMDRIYTAIGSRLPILVHLGDEKLTHATPKKLSNVLDRFYNITVIGAHLGGYSKWDEAEEYIIGRNLYLDTSSVLLFMDNNEAVRLMLKHGTKKILFGTDYPIIYVDEELEMFDKLPLTDTEKEDILYNNAKKLLGLL